MLFSFGSTLISESAAADLLDKDVDPTVKDVVKELEDDLTTNVELVDPEDKETNNVVLTAEACTVFESSIGGGKYAVDIRDIIRICEAEEEETGEVPDAGEVAQDVASANGVDADDLVIVAPADVAADIIESALLEAKGSGSGKAKKKLKGMKKAVAELKSKGLKIATIGKKKK